MKEDYTVWKIFGGYLLILLFMIISSSANGQTYSCDGDICVVEFKYPLVHMLIEMIRSKIISSSKNKNNTNIPAELNKLWDLITGPQFTTQFRLLYNNLKKIDEASKKIDSTIRKQTANQQKHINASFDIQKEMILNMVTSVGSESLPPDLIEFDDND